MKEFSGQKGSPARCAGSTENRGPEFREASTSHAVYHRKAVLVKPRGRKDT